MTFAWTDRDGKRHELTDPKPILDEAEATAREIDRLVTLADNPEPTMRNAARDAIRLAHGRLERLRADLARWNVHAEEATRRAAAELSGQIDELPATLTAVTLVVALHDEHDRLLADTAGDPAARANLLAEPMTALQRRAAAASGLRSPLSETATYGQAKVWLDGQPRFARRRGTDGGWFTWTDRHGHAHRLPDPLPIERELVAIARELLRLKLRLGDQGPVDAIYTAVIAGVRSWERLRVLQGDLERFEREAKARDDGAWETYAADWRSKRKMT